MKIVPKTRTQIAFDLGKVDQQRGEWRDVPAYLEPDYLAGREEALEEKDRRARVNEAQWWNEHGFVFV